MDPTIVFFFQFAFGFVLLAIATRWYFLPRLRAIPTNRALAIVLFGGAVRYMGTILLVPSVAPLTEGSGLSGAVGDVICATLAVIALLANHAGARSGRLLAWVYVIIGGADLIMVTLNGFRTEMWAHLGGAWTFVVLIFPAIAMAFILTILFLVKPNATSAT